MAIKNYDEFKLSERLNELLSPSDPIRSEEHLKGRDRNLEEIRRNLRMKGRHVFIFGDRGVGKTSLAQTAAVSFHPSTSSPICVACGSGETFETVMGAVAKRVYAEFKGLKRDTSVKVSIPFISATLKTSIDAGEQPQISSLNDAVDALGSGLIASK